MRLEVRCCCKPERLLGFLDVEERDARRGARLSFRCQRLIDPRDLDSRSDELPYTETVIVSLVVALLNISTIGTAYLALQSDDYPIEELRAIPGFVEACYG